LAWLEPPIDTFVTASNSLQATQGSTYTDPDFSSHYEGATQGGFIRGAYHVADPSGASGAAQAQYFLAHGGGWTHDGITLPGTLQLVAASSGSSCYGLSTSAMVSWIKDFSSTYESSTGRYPIIYTDTTWWNSCTGSSTAFASNSPLYVQKFASSAGTLPAGWGFYTFWQDNDSFEYGGNSDVFNGAYSQLQSIATGKPSS
jgi:GH25 family lysozyme M1 (1,4-beta-N-acetylmuramidase)